MLGTLGLGRPNLSIWARPQTHVSHLEATLSCLWCLQSVLAQELMSRDLALLPTFYVILASRCTALIYKRDMESYVATAVRSKPQHVFSGRRPG